MRRPEEINKTIETATSATTRAERRRCRRPPTPARAPSRSPSNLEAGGGLERGEHSEPDPREGGDESGEGEDSRIERRLLGDGKARGRELDEKRQGEGGENEPDGAAENGEGDALGQELTHEPLLAGTERRADGELFLSLHSPAQQKVGEVGAGDEKNADRGPEEGREQQPSLHRDVVVQRVDRRTCLLVLLGILPRELFGNELHLGASFVDSDARTKLRQHPQITVFPIVEILVVRELQRGPKLGGGVGEVELPRHHSHDGRRVIVESYRLSHDVPAPAKNTLPQAVAEDDDLRRPHAVVLGHERTPHQGRHAENPEELSLYRRVLQPNRISLPHEIHRERVVCGHRLERRAHPLPVPVIGR